MQTVASMPATACLGCHGVGFVRKEFVLCAGVATTTYRCGQCGHAWHRSRSVDSDGPSETAMPSHNRLHLRT